MSKVDRKFDTWEWRDTNLCAQPIHVEVRYTRPENVAGNGPTTFYIKNVDPAVDISDGDLSALREKLNVALRAFYHVEWVPYLVVEFDPHRDQPGDAPDTAYTLGIRIWRLERASLPSGFIYRDAPDDRFTGKSWVGRGHGIRNAVGVHEDRRFSLLADNEANRAAIDQILDGFHTLRENLFGLVTEDLATRLLSMPINQISLQLVKSGGISN